MEEGGKTPSPVLLRIFFSLPIHPQEALQNWSIQCKSVGLPTKCSIELLVAAKAKLILVIWRDYLKKCSVQF